MKKIQGTQIQQNSNISTNKKPQHNTLITDKNKPQVSKQSVNDSSKNKTVVITAKEQDKQLDVKQKIFKIKMKIQLNDVKKKMDELTIKLKNNKQKIWLDLTTCFNDESFLQFSTQFIKIVSQINYLTWRVEGEFTDKGQARSVGEIVGRLQNVYRLELDVRCPYFGDQGLNFLGLGFKKLKNLHQLVCDIPYDETRMLPEQEDNKLIEVLSTLPNLEILKFETLNRKNMKMYKKVSNLQRDICEYYDFSYDMNIREEEYLIQNTDKLVSVFNEDILSMQERLTSIKFYPYMYNGSNPPYIKLMQQLYIKYLKCCFQLPYLTEFQTPSRAIEETYIPIQDYSIILFNLAKSRYQQILQTIIYQNYLQDIQTMNPKIILVDMWVN